MSHNDITGDRIATRTVNDTYRDNYDTIFGKKERKTFDFTQNTDPLPIPAKLLRKIELNANFSREGALDAFSHVTIPYDGLVLGKTQTTPYQKELAEKITQMGIRTLHAFPGTDPNVTSEHKAKEILRVLDQLTVLDLLARAVHHLKAHAQEYDHKGDPKLIEEIEEELKKSAFVECQECGDTGKVSCTQGLVWNCYNCRDKE